MAGSQHIRTMRAVQDPDRQIAVGATAVIRNDQGGILLCHCPLSGAWRTPSGLAAPGEAPATTALRVVLDETGLHVRVTRLVGIYSGEQCQIPTSTGDFVPANITAFECELVGGAAQTTPALDYAWFAPDALPDAILPQHRTCIEHALTRTEPYFHLLDHLH